MSSIRITPSGVDESQFATAAQGAKADSAVQVVGSLNVGDVIEWDGSQWVPALQPLPHAAVVTGLTPVLATTGTVVAQYAGVIGGARWFFVSQSSTASWDVIVDAGTYDVTLITQTNSVNAVATIEVDGTTVGTVDTYSASLAENVFFTISGVSLSRGRHVLRVSNPTANPSATNFRLLVYAVQLVRTGA